MERFFKLFPSPQLLICLHHTFRLLRREITCEKMGFTSVKPAQCVEILQSIAFSKPEEEYNKNFNSAEEHEN